MVMHAKIKEPINPEIVLFGLILVNFGPLNILPTINPPISDAIHPKSSVKISLIDGTAIMRGPILYKKKLKK